MAQILGKDPSRPPDLAEILREILRRLEALERRKVGGGDGG
jgi:hypothetical protein